MKISIDFDGTLWHHMKFFREFMWAMTHRGHQVGILTGHSLEIREKDIALMIDRGFPHPDFYVGRTPESPASSNFKLEMISHHNIDIHFDDFDFDDPETTQVFNSSWLRQKIIKVPWKVPKDSSFE